MWRSMLFFGSCLAVGQAFVVPPTTTMLRTASLRAPESAVQMFFFGTKKEEAAPSTATNARDRDFQKRQERLQQRQAKNTAQPKGTVEVTFPQKGNKVVMAKQGEPLGKVISRGGMRVKFDCKNGRCGTCQVRLNGRSVVKVCQGGTIPGGATRKLSIKLDN